MIFKFKVRFNALEATWTKLKTPHNLPSKPHGEKRETRKPYDVMPYQ